MLSSLQSLSKSTKKTANKNSCTACLPITERLFELLFSQTNNVTNDNNLQMRELLVEEYERCVHLFLSSSSSSSELSEWQYSSSSSPPTASSTHSTRCSRSVTINQTDNVLTSETFAPIKCIIESVNRAVIGNIRGFPGPMCSPFRRKHFEMLKSNDYLVTEKSDGLRVIAVMCRAHLFPHWMGTCTDPLPISLDNIANVMELERAAMKLAKGINNFETSSESECSRSAQEEMVNINNNEYVLSRYFKSTELEHVNEQMLNENKEECYSFRALAPEENKEVASNIWLLVRSMRSQCLTFMLDRCMDATYMLLSTINLPLYEFAIFDCELLQLFPEEYPKENKFLCPKEMETCIETENKYSNEDVHQKAHTERVDTLHYKSDKSRFALALFDLYAYREIVNTSACEISFTNTFSANVSSLETSQVVYLTRKKMSERYELLKKVASELCVTAFRSSDEVLWYVKELLPLQQLPKLLERITNDEKTPCEYWYHHYYYERHEQEQEQQQQEEEEEEEQINVSFEDSQIEFKKMLSMGKTQNDGFIFTPDDFPLVTGASKTQLKWKWRQKLSIDWRISRLEQHKNEFKLSLYFYKHNYNHREDTVGHWTLSLPTEMLNPHKYFIPVKNEWVIAECVYDEQQCKWSIDKIRTDKREANSIVTAISIYESLVEHVTLHTLLSNLEVEIDSTSPLDNLETLSSSWFALKQQEQQERKKEIISQEKQQDIELECESNEEHERQKKQQVKIQPICEQEKEEYSSDTCAVKPVEPAKFILRAIRSNTGVIKCMLWWTTNESNEKYKNNIPCFHCEVNECYGLLPSNKPLYGTPFSVLESYLLIRLANAGGSYAWSDFVVDAIFNGEIGAWEIVQCYDDASNKKKQTSFDYTLQHLEQLMHKKTSYIPTWRQFEQLSGETFMCDANKENNYATSHKGINNDTDINDFCVKTDCSHQCNPENKKLCKNVSTLGQINAGSQTQSCKTKMLNEAIEFWNSYMEYCSNIVIKNNSNNEECNVKRRISNTVDTCEDDVVCDNNCENNECVSRINNSHGCETKCNDNHKSKCKKVRQLLQSMQLNLVELGVKYVREHREQQRRQQRQQQRQQKIQKLEEYEEEEEEEEEEQSKQEKYKNVININNKELIGNKRKSNHQKYNNECDNHKLKKFYKSKNKSGKVNYQYQSNKRNVCNKKYETEIYAADVSNYCRTYLAKWQSVQPTFVSVSSTSLSHLTVAAAEYCVSEGMSVKIPSNRKSKGFRGYFALRNFFNSKATYESNRRKLDDKSLTEWRTYINVVSCDTIRARTIVNTHEFDESNIYNFVQNISSLLVQKGVFIGLFYDDVTSFDNKTWEIEQYIFDKNTSTFQSETSQELERTMKDNVTEHKESCLNNTAHLPVAKEERESINVNNDFVVERKTNDLCDDGSWKLFENICSKYNLRLIECYEYNKFFDKNETKERCCHFERSSSACKRERDGSDEHNSHVANLTHINDNYVREILQKFSAFMFVKEEAKE